MFSPEIIVAMNEKAAKEPKAKVVEPFSPEGYTNHDPLFKVRRDVYDCTKSVYTTVNIDLTAHHHVEPCVTEHPFEDSVSIHNVIDWGSLHLSYGQRAIWRVSWLSRSVV